MTDEWAALPLRAGVETSNFRATKRILRGVCLYCGRAVWEIEWKIGGVTAGHDNLDDDNRLGRHEAIFDVATMREIGEYEYESMIARDV